MSYEKGPDEPAFDIISFEAAAQDRASELVTQVSRLALFNIAGAEPAGEDEPAGGWLQIRGAQYHLDDDTQIEVQHDTHNDADRVHCRVRVTPPHQDFLGHDGHLRRVHLSRQIEYHSFMAEIEAGIKAEAEVSEHDTKDGDLDHLGEAYMKKVRLLRLEQQLDPDYRPAELIRAVTRTEVERLLPNRRAFATERFSKNMHPEVRTAHIAARRLAGESPRNPEYTVAEHKALITKLAAIEIAGASPLEEPFDDADWGWVDESVAIRSWHPRHG